MLAVWCSRFKFSVSFSTLPLRISTTNIMKSRQRDTSSTPVARLDDCLYELAVADHVRSLQMMYRDGYDEQQLASELRKCLVIRRKRFSHPPLVSLDGKLMTKDLLSEMRSGRSRCLTMLKLAYGDQSLAYIRGLADVANTYALEGMWAQAEEKTLLAWAKMVAFEEHRGQHSSGWHQRITGAISAARSLQAVYSTLRKHVINNAGQVKRALMQELTGVFEQTLGDVADFVPFLTALDTFLASTKSKLPLKQLSASYFQDKQPYGNNRSGAAPSGEEVKTWSDVILFLRSHEAIQSWLRDIDHVLLPQHKAGLMLPFTACDLEDSKQAHPGQIVSVFMQYPQAMKIVSGSTFLRTLEKLPLEVPLQVNTTGAEAVSYELPVALEEYISLYVLESTLLTLEHPHRILMMQILSLKGLCAVHLQGQLEAAEETFKKALHELESATQDMDLVACELYNAIAQMLMSKFQIWQSSRKQRYRAEAEQWLRSGAADAVKAIKQQLKLVRKQYDYRSQPISAAEMEYEAKVLVLKARIKQLYDEKEHDFSEMETTLQAAFRYLVKTVDIWESLGPMSSSTGPSTHTVSPIALASASLAVASVCNLSRNYEATREWLTRAMRIFERQSWVSDSTGERLPRPGNAMAFTQTQLAQTLEHLGFEAESKAVWLRARQHYMDEAQRLLDERSTQLEQDAAADDPLQQLLSEQHTHQQHQQQRSRYYHHVGALPLILRHSQLEAALTSALQATQQVVAFCKRCQRGTSDYEVSMYLEEMAKMMEVSYGWDSAEAAEVYRQAGQRCVAAGDLQRGLKHLVTAMQAYQTIYGAVPTAASSAASSSGPVEGQKTLQQLQKLIERVRQRMREGQLTVADDVNNNNVTRANKKEDDDDDNHEEDDDDHNDDDDDDNDDHDHSHHNQDDMHHDGGKPRSPDSAHKGMALSQIDDILRAQLHEAEKLRHEREDAVFNRLRRGFSQDSENDSVGHTGTGAGGMMIDVVFDPPAPVHDTATTADVVNNSNNNNTNNNSNNSNKNSNKNSSNNNTSNNNNSKSNVDDSRRGSHSSAAGVDAGAGAGVAGGVGSGWSVDDLLGGSAGRALAVPVAPVTTTTTNNNDTSAMSSLSSQHIQPPSTMPHLQPEPSQPSPITLTHKSGSGSAPGSGSAQHQKSGMALVASRYAGLAPEEFFGQPLEQSRSDSPSREGRRFDSQTEDNLDRTFLGRSELQQPTWPVQVVAVAKNTEEAAPTPPKPNALTLAVPTPQEEDEDKGKQAEVVDNGGGGGEEDEYADDYEDEYAEEHFDS